MKRILGAFFLWAALSTSVYADDPKLSVTGNATVVKPADKLAIAVGVESYDRDKRKAVADNAEKMRSVQEALKAIGLTEKEVQTRNFVLLPQMTPAPKNPPANWMPEIAGYQVRNTLEIHTTRLELAGEIIDAVSKVGGNQIQDLSFSLQDEESAKTEALIKAFQQADRYAKALANEAHLQLGEVLELSVGQAYVGMRAFKVQALSVEAQTPISPKDVEVSASVSLAYQIQGLAGKKA